MAKKFKVGELCLIAANASQVDANVVRYLGETVEVVAVASWMSPIKANGAKWDYSIAHADGRRFVCLEPALRKRPPPNEKGIMAELTRATGWAPKQQERTTT